MTHPQLDSGKMTRGASAHHRWLALPDGGCLRYAIHGREHRGTPLLLLRPFAGSIDLWGSFRAALAENFCVVAFDPRGLGGSSAVRAATSTRSMARDALAVLDGLGIGRAHVVGLSLGGMVATWLAIDAPARIDRLVLLSTFARGLSAMRNGARVGLRFARCLARPADEVEAACVRNVLSDRFRAEHPDRVRSIERRVVAEHSSRADVLERLAVAARHDARSRLHEITAPTLVLSGQCDRLVSEATIADLVDTLPDARSEIVAGSGHDLSLERPRATAQRIRRFLQDPGSPLRATLRRP